MGENLRQLQIESNHPASGWESSWHGMRITEDSLVASQDPGWEHFPHGADIGVRGVGATKAQAFEQAGVALTAVVTEPSGVRPLQAVSIVCEAADDALLLADWLNALVYEMGTRRMLFSTFAVSIDGTRLTGTATGEPVDRLRHEPAVEVKGATYTGLRVARTADGSWVAECVVDV